MRGTREHDFTERRDIWIDLVQEKRNWPRRGLLGRDIREQKQERDSWSFFRIIEQDQELVKKLSILKTFICSLHFFSSLLKKNKTV